MDLSFSKEELAFRDEVRAFFKASRAGDDAAEAGRGPPSLQGRDGGVVSHPQQEGLGRARTGRRNMAAPAGARCSTTSSTKSCSSRRRRSRLPFGVSMVGPVIYTFGNEAQKKRFLPRIANVDDWWCQGFSEPGAGSDLASLKTKAEKKGDKYIVNGQKTWTTLAQYADWIFCLCRTDPTAKKQSGISFILIDMKTQGHLGAPDPDHRRRRRGQRSVLRRRRGAAGESGRRGEQGLGLRQIPARQ